MHLGTEAFPDLISLLLMVKVLTDFVIFQDSKKYKFELPGLHCSLSDLSEVAYELTQVPSSRQRLIYKGIFILFGMHRLSFQLYLWNFWVISPWSYVIPDFYAFL